MAFSSLGQWAWRRCLRRLFLGRGPDPPRPSYGDSPARQFDSQVRQLPKQALDQAVNLPASADCSTSW